MGIPKNPCGGVADITDTAVARALGFKSAPALLGQLRNGPVNLQMFSTTPLVPRSTFGTGTDVSPLIEEAGEYLRGRTGARGTIELPAGQYRLKTGIGDKLAGHILRGQNDIATTLYYDPVGGAGIAINLDGADGTSGGWGGGAIENLRLTLGDGPHVGAAFALYCNAVNAGGTMSAPDQLRIENVLINAENPAARRFYGGLHIDGILRTSPQGVRVGNVRNVHIYDTSTYAMYCRSLVQFAFSNIGSYGSGVNDFYFAGGGTALTDSYTVSAQHINCNGALHINNVRGLNIDARCGALYVSNTDYARGFIERGGAMSGAFGPKSSVVVMGP